MYEYDVTNARPSIRYEYNLSETVLGSVEIDLSQSFDDGGEIVQYASFFLNDGVFSNYSEHGAITSRTLLRSGTNTLCLRVVDNTAIERVSCFDIVYNGEIAPSYTLTELSQQAFDPRFYYPFQSCNVADGKELKEIVFTFKDDSGEYEQIIDSVDALVFVPQAGEYIVDAYCVDSSDLKSNTISLNFVAEFDLGKPDAYVELAELDYSTNGRLYAPSLENSVPSPFANYITTYKYAAKNLETEETFNYSFDFSFPDIEFPSYGTWEISYTVIDDFGIESDPYVFSLDIQMVAPVAGIVFKKNEGDPGDRQFNVVNEFSSSGTSPNVKYYFSFFNPSSGESFELTPEQPYIGFTFPSFGTWNLTYIVENEQGLKSEPLLKTFEVLAKLPVASVSLALYESEPRNLTYKVISEDSSVGSGYFISNYKYEFINFDTGESFQINNGYGQSFTNFSFSSGGNWSVKYTVENDFGLISEPFNFTLNVVERDPDEEPPQPDPIANKSTLEGIDSDGDGVRDDVEIFINEIPDLTILQRKTFKDYVKKLVGTYSTDNIELRDNKYKIILFRYCLVSRVGKDKYKGLVGEINYKFFNTRSRLLAYARSEENFKGASITLEKDIHKYESFCD
mgnify:CR=1 FL=1